MWHASYCLLSTVYCLLFLGFDPRSPGSGFAQPPHQAHRLDLFPMPEGNADDFLTHRFNDKRYEQIAEKLKELKVEPEMLEKLKNPEFLKMLQQMSQQPEFRERFKDFKPADLRGKITPELIDQVKSKMQKSGGADSGQGKAEGETKPADANAEPKAEDKSITPPAMEKPGSGAADEEVDPLADSRLGGFLERFANRIDPNWRNSEAAHRFMHALTEHMGEKDERLEQVKKGASAIAGRWSDLAGSMHLDQVIPKEHGSWWDRFKPPSLRPDLGGEMPTHLARPEAPAGQQENRLGGVLGVLSALGCVAALLIGGRRMLAWLLPPEDHSGRRARQALGPWPVDPAAVASRDDIVRAFEYLSILRIGPAARNWNHRLIARRLAAVPGRPRPQEAHQLATLYERARYAPSEDNLPEEAFTEARRDLRVLAEV